MREIIDEVLNGNYGSETGSLDFSRATIECFVAPGEELSGSFVIRGDGANVVHGRVLSTDYRMECLTKEFSGMETEVSYAFHANGCEPGEVVKGAFRVISSVGEYSLPYVVKCQKKSADGGLEGIQSLADFVALAREHWQEAVAYFYSDAFEEMLSINDKELLPVYRGLSVYAKQEQNVEEFLISTERKQPVEFTPSRTSVETNVPEKEGEYRLLEQEISISKSGYGYVALNVECDGAFLSVEKEVLLEEDFLGNDARIPFYVDDSRLKEGKNRGKLIFYNSFVNFEVEVTVTMGEKHVLNLASLQWKETIVSVMREYERFRTRRISMTSWLEKTATLVDKLIAMDDKDPMPVLFKAQILITKDRPSEAQWLLSRAADLIDAKENWSDELWAYYLYLTTLISREEDQIVQVTDEVDAIYRRNPNSWRIAWLLIYLSAEYAAVPSEKLRFLEQQFENGCRSFVIYLEALQLYLSNPALLRKLGNFEKQVLYYGVRKDFCSPDLAERFLGLMEKEKGYSPILCRILERLYRKRKDARIVSQLCELFVRGGILGKRALPWYEKGIEQQLRITNLYESFMASIDPNEKRSLPKAAVLYFSYQNKLDYERSAFLYDYVLDNKVLCEEVYDKYVLKCRDFVTEQIAKGRINRHLARIYAKILTPQIISHLNANDLVRVLFATRIKVKDERMKKVILYAKGSLIGREYPLGSGETCAPIYGEETTIIFEDAYGNRFADEVPREIERYMQPDPYVGDLRDREVDVPEFDLWLLERSGEEAWDEILSKKAQDVCAWEGLEKELKKELSLRLMRQYYESEQPEKMDEVLLNFQNVDLSLKERMEIAKYAVLRGNYKLVSAWMHEFGPYFLDGNTLARLVGSLILNGCGEDECITAAATYLFHRDKASAAMLEYVSLYGEGMMKDLRDLWKAMRESELDVTALEERMLIQMIYSGGFVSERTEIFERYYRAAGETSVTKAYVVKSAFNYFVREKTADGIVFRILLDEYKSGAILPKVCKLAFLKYYAEHQEEVSREVDGVLDAFLREMMAEKIHFAFYAKLTHQKALLGELADKVIVEYRTKPGGKARIHYLITQDGAARQEYLSENMRDVFWGICCREFVLFFGETLEYYVTEEIGGKESMTISGKVQCPQPDQEAARSKYGMINDAVMSLSMGNDAALDETLDQYYFKEFCGENLFKMR